MTLPLWQIPTSELYAELDRRKKFPPRSEGAIASVVRAVSMAFKVSEESLLGHRRESFLCRARFASWIILADRGFNNSTIAVAFDRACHSTIRYGLMRGKHFEKADPAFARFLKLAIDVMNGAALPPPEEDQGPFLFDLQALDERRTA